jgi:hypothetical protein
LRRNCFLRQVIKGKIIGGVEVTGWQGRRRRKLLDDLKEGRDTHIWRGEGWRRSVRPSMWEMKKYCLESRNRGISDMK